MFVFAAVLEVLCLGRCMCNSDWSRVVVTLNHETLDRQDTPCNAAYREAQMVKQSVVKSEMNHNGRTIAVESVVMERGRRRHVRMLRKPYPAKIG